MKVRLTSRQQHILWATVRHYIATAEPVGSKALVEEYDLGVSSATIRNVMGVLEKSGLLYQPHTSAGRVPSDSGYRIYVDQLITPSDAIGKQVEQALQTCLKWEDLSLEILLQGATQILATISGCIGLITMPQNSVATLRHLQLVQVEAGRVMLIVVTDDYETHSKVMDLLPSKKTSTPDSEVIDRELQIVSNFLNAHLRGKNLVDLANLSWNDLDKEFQSYGELLKKSITELTSQSSHGATTQIMIRGMSEVLRQPEFAQIKQVQTIIQLLEEEQEQLRELIFTQSETSLSDEFDRPKVTVRIGSENPLQPIQTCTLISSTYSRGSIPVGSVGVLGPTRMDYEGAIAVVSAAADYLSDALS
ncbi:MAG: heat-inducible transcriptional repressor HrcA [Cyanobacteria bacterium P01_A01_bin.84]